ncbi:MAG TPA: hypothetical protein VKE22_22145 [Haliangiales bacterium]|nr:hypothetical protein [Haliangiales bacterium]
MLFLESSARLVLVLHAVVGAAVVASTTHLVVWAWKLRRGQARRAGGTRWLALVGAGLYGVQFVLGNLMYPVYKVRVRAEYFESPAAVGEDARARRARSLGGVTPPKDGEDEPPPRLERLAHLFDIKEHIVALGLALAVAAAFLVRGEERRGLLLFCVAGAAACAWTGGLVGLWVASFRSVGAL